MVRENDPCGDLRVDFRHALKKPMLQVHAAILGIHDALVLVVRDRKEIPRFSDGVVRWRVPGHALALAPLDEFLAFAWGELAIQVWLSLRAH